MTIRKALSNILTLAALLLMALAFLFVAGLVGLGVAEVSGSKTLGLGVFLLTFLVILKLQDPP
jgi:hypothetical protein